MNANQVLKWAAISLFIVLMNITAYGSSSQPNQITKQTAIQYSTGTKHTKSKLSRKERRALKKQIRRKAKSFLGDILLGMLLLLLGGAVLAFPFVLLGWWGVVKVIAAVFLAVELIITILIFAFSDA